MKRTLAFLAAVLLSAPSLQAVDEATKASPEFKEMMAKAQTIYLTNCMACHQMDGTGQIPGSPRLAPPLSGSDWLNDDDRIIRIVLHGMVGEITVGDVTMTGAMVKYGTTVPLDDTQVALVLSFIRNSWGNSGKLISPKRVARVREATKDREVPYTVEEILAAHPLKSE